MFYNVLTDRIKSIICQNSSDAVLEGLLLDVVCYDIGMFDILLCSVLGRGRMFIFLQGTRWNQRGKLVESVEKWSAANKLCLSLSRTKEMSSSILHPYML